MNSVEAYGTRGEASASVAQVLTSIARPVAQCGLHPDA
jgi:hypothetical protein